MALTGKRRYRVNWQGKLILQVQEAVTFTDNCGGFIDCRPGLIWRDARPQDVTVEDTTHD